MLGTTESSSYLTLGKQQPPILKYTYLRYTKPSTKKSVQHTHKHRHFPISRSSEMPYHIAATTDAVLMSFA